MKAVDLFAGAGGLALGLSQAGFDQTMLVEWDHYACATIRKNVKRRLPGTEKWRLLESNVADVDYSTMAGGIDRSAMPAILRRWQGPRSPGSPGYVLRSYSSCRRD